METKFISPKKREVCNHNDWKINCKICNYTNPKNKNNNKPPKPNSDLFLDITKFSLG